MNLGDIYLKSAVLILTGSFGLGFFIAIVWRLFKKIRWSTIILITIAGGLITPIALTSFHHSLFTAWHQHQNQFIPQTGCITYEPSFTRLYATFRMDRTEFDTWVSGHPWQLKPSDDKSSVSAHDGLATDSAPNGKQLRVYHKDGVMYLTYNSM